MKYILAIFFSFSFLLSFSQQHPCTFINTAEIKGIKKGLNSNPLFKESYQEIKDNVDAWIAKGLDVPVPKDAAGGYTHEKHKENYNQMFYAGLMYNITGEKKYFDVVRAAFLKYAALNPTLKNHPEATSTSPGRIFWQALNDANWLVYAGMAYDMIAKDLSVADKKTIADGAFKPIVDYFLGERKDWFNLIHNHAVWACAGVGIVGIATDNEEYVKAALYGFNAPERAGFLAHMDLLFSPDGYYNEGPYYTRYAVLPFYLFAASLDHAKPEMKIFQYRNSILQKALNGALEQTNTDGAFYSYNDALKEKTYTSNEIVVAIGIARKAYGENDSYLPIAKAQDRVVINEGGLLLAKELAGKKQWNKDYPYKSVEFKDGAKGEKGGVSIIRNGGGKNLSSLIFKYSSHGLSHGHYDKLNINLYDGGSEILQDYGAARFIGVEQKYGGRYLPETRTYAQQTIAHNTVTVDGNSHFNGVEDESEKYAPTKIFSSVGNNAVQVVSSLDTNAYKNVKMQRTIYSIMLPDAKKPLYLDLFKLLSNSFHKYDLPFNYAGTVIETNFKYQAFNKKQEALGTKNGYQFLWNEAEAHLGNTMTQFTFLNNNKFYTISSICGDSSNRNFTRVGASDPNFNLRPQTSYIISADGMNKTFVNIIELHGNHNTVNEVASAAYPAVTKVELLTDTDEYSAVETIIKGNKLLVVQNNKGKTGQHNLTISGKQYAWDGAYQVYYNNIKIQ